MSDPCSGVPRRVRHRISVAAAVLLFGCGDPEPGASGPTVQIDTLPDGVVHVQNPAEGLWAPGEEWRLVEELRIGTVEGDGPDAFGSMIPALEVDDLGRIWVVDQMSHEVRVFDADGEHVRTLGGEGEGPGELRMPFQIYRGPEGHMWVADAMNLRLSVFDTAGTFQASHPRPSPTGFPLDTWGFGPDGSFLEVGMEMSGGPSSSAILFRLNADLEPVDTMALPSVEREVRQVTTEGGRFGAPVPFTPEAISAVTPNHQLWTGVNDAFRLARTTLEGDTLRVTEREWVPEPVTEGDVEAALEQIDFFLEAGGEMDPAEFPSVKPAFRQILVDEDGRPWVAPFHASASAPWDRFHVFDPEGIYLGEVAADPPMAPGVVRFRGDRVYATVSDDLDVVHVIRYRVEGR